MQKERFWNWGILALCLVGAIISPVLATSAPIGIENCPAGMEIDLLDPDNADAGTSHESKTDTNACSDTPSEGAVIPAPSEPTVSPAVLTTLDREFSFVDGSRTGYQIPDGSRIRYGLGITDVYGPGGMLIATIADDHASDWFIPTGNRSTTPPAPARCTHSIEVPNGTHIFHCAGFDSLSLNPDGTDPFTTIEYAPELQPQPEYTPEQFIPAPRGEDQWVADFSRGVSPDVQEFRASWSVARSPQWPDIAQGVTDDIARANAKRWQFAIFNGIETPTSYHNGHWCGILQPVLHWNAVEKPDAQRRGTGQNLQIANEGVTGAFPGTAEHGRWSIASHSVGGHGNVDTHTPLQHLTTRTPEIVGQVLRTRTGWDVVTTSLTGGIPPAHLFTHDLDPSTHANNLEAVLTLERHSGFTTDFQKVPTR